MTIAKLLEIQFQGYFMCRIATDPDPTNEQRGVSGYTLALITEDPLDQVIRTQIDGPDADAFLARNLREPAQLMGIRIGVDVNNVLFDGKPYFGAARDALIGARVYLEGKDEPFEGPIYDSRNNLVGSDDNMSFVVNPFEMAIRKKGDRGDDLLSIRAVDYLNPQDPQQKIWQIQDPALYARRLPSFNPSSTPAQAAIRVYDGHEYFADRVAFLRQRLAELEQGKAAARDDSERAAIETRIQTLRTRLYQLDFWGGRFESKLAFQVTYAFNVNGPQAVEDPRNRLGGKVDSSHSWPVTFWFGSWDGDLLIGWMQGSLSLPFRPDGAAA
ncbi:MAG TPA: hypothetical protein VHN15_03115 [Thermoanaerobaculia bacterium]|nr:hypothetical protein [Thermoanaerobaculia bacterium]